MWWLISIASIVLAYIIFEYRLKKPDQVILHETRDGFGIGKHRFYARHFSLPIDRSTHSFQMTVAASAKGNLEVRAKLAVTVAASLSNLSALIRVGGWNSDVVSRAARQLEVALQGLVKEFTEVSEIEGLSSERIQEYLVNKSRTSNGQFGLDIVYLAIIVFEPVNPQIVEALRQREQARILEQTETLNQAARIAAARAKLKADEEIALLENEFELKKFDLRKIQLEKEAMLANSRVEDELKRSRLRLEFEKEEISLMERNPELLLLTPQAARLAEASQSLKNARTVVSIAPGDIAQGSEVLGMFQKLLQGALDSFRRKKEGEA